MRAALVDPTRTQEGSTSSGCREPHPSLVPAPSSPDDPRRRECPDDEARERAHDLTQVTHFGDIREERPLPLRDLEAACR